MPKEFELMVVSQKEIVEDVEIIPKDKLMETKSKRDDIVESHCCPLYVTSILMFRTHRTHSNC